MKLVDISLSRTDYYATLVGRFLREGSNTVEELFIRVPERHFELLRESRDAFLPVLMLPCMRTGESLDMGGPVSARLLDQLSRIQEIFLAWYADFKPVEIHAVHATESHSRGPATSAFFSAGADSFHTLREALNGNIRDVDRLDYLIFVRSTAGQDFRGFGLPIALGELNESSGLEQELDDIAAATGTEIIKVDTNVQGLFPDFNWSLYHHGGALASIAIALSQNTGTQIISSGWSFRDVHPWGSHPFTDPLWSTEYLQFIHYGNHVTRAEKIAEVIAVDSLALKHLRVCNYNSSITNCSRCYKCLRTMIPLDMVGKLLDAETFSSTMPANIMAAFLHDQGSLEDEPLYRLARKLGHTDYMHKIESLINKRNRRRSMIQYLESSPLFSQLVAPLRRVRRILLG